jgi:hypothetical protein
MNKFKLNLLFLVSDLSPFTAGYFELWCNECEDMLIKSSDYSPREKYLSCFEGLKQKKKFWAPNFFFAKKMYKHFYRKH